jgi:hypothetical protein
VIVVDEKTATILLKVDRVVWYMQKLSMSIGALKENPSEENLNKTMKAISQVKEALQVDTSPLERAVVDYFKLAEYTLSDPARDDGLLDDAATDMIIALKSALLEIIYKWILREPQASEA